MSLLKGLNVRKKYTTEDRYVTMTLTSTGRIDFTLDGKMITDRAKVSEWNTRATLGRPMVRLGLKRPNNCEASASENGSSPSKKQKANRNNEEVENEATSLPPIAPPPPPSSLFIVPPPPPLPLGLLSPTSLKKQRRLRFASISSLFALLSFLPSSHD